MSDRERLSRENKALKNRLEIAQHELGLIKGSKGYRAVRLIGYTKSELRKSPVGFSKKVIKKLVKKGSLKQVSTINTNLTLVEDLETQYKDWITFNEPDSTEFEDQKTKSDKFLKRPLFSIITPVFNPPVDVLEELIKSVLSQTYPYFELCLGDFGDDESVKALIKAYVKKDGRIKTWKMDNKGIASNSNVILKKAKGDYIALLDHDDTLSPDALYENALLINKAPYDFIYSDKDKIDEAGKRFEPFFKPDWSPEIMLNANYLTHLNIMRTSIVNQVGGWSSDTDGAQDWDLFLKVVDKSKTIGHIPKVLYHWRVLKTSTAHSIDTKPYALKGQRVAVDRFLQKKKIPAKTYHHGAELLLDWKKEKDSSVVLVKAHSYASLKSFINELSSIKDLDFNKNKWIVLHSFSIEKELKLQSPVIDKYVQFKKGDYLKAVDQIIKSQKTKSVIFIDDKVNPKSFASLKIEDLTAWLHIEGVGAVGARIIDHDTKATVDAGAFITGQGIKPIFTGSYDYHQAAIGNIEWVRNLKIITPLLFAVKTEDLAKALKKLSTWKSDKYANSAVQIEISNKHRVVLNPKFKVSLQKGSAFSTDSYYQDSYGLLLDIVEQKDQYFNSNLSSENPMNLTKIVQKYETLAGSNDLMLSYTQEAFVHASSNSISSKELEDNVGLINDRSKSPIKIKKVLIILPGFQAIYAGLNNIFSYAEFLTKNNIEVAFAIITSEANIKEHAEIVSQKFPETASKSKFMATNIENTDKLPAADVAICTQWATAYILAKYNKTSRKCYFIQDKEASFYPKGSISALVENTYKMGFFGLANTPGLLEWYKNDYNGDGVVIKSRLDLSTYFPKSETPRPVKKPYKVFFYARPNEPRNAFELGAAALFELKRRLKGNVEIFTAGASWDPVSYGLENTVINLGKIEYSKVPAFYRSMDVGMMFMFSGHPGVVASELMASGCPVVVNQYDDATWNNLYENEKDCLVSPSTASAIADNLERALKDHELREKIIANGFAKVKEFYKDYEKSCEGSLLILEKPLERK